MGMRRVALLTAALAAGGCLIINNAGGQGSVRVAWVFPENRTCAQAGATQVQLTLSPRASGGSNLSPTLVDCAGSNYTINNVREGEYTLQIDSVNTQNVIEYTASVNVLVVGGKQTDLGQVTLGRLLGELTVDWQFQMTAPATPTQECARAGVKDVQVVIDDATGATVFNDAWDCLQGPAAIGNLQAGSYRVSLYGLYYQSTVPFQIYELTGIPADVTLEHTTALGLQTLQMNTANFGDINVSWTLPGGETCASSGLGDLTVSIFRDTVVTADDTFTAACTVGELPAHRGAPGRWRVDMTGTGTGSVAYTGSITVDVAPTMTANAPVVLHHN